MPGPIIQNPTPYWLKPENASVLDSVWTRLARSLADLGGITDPSAAVTGLMAPMIPEGGNLALLGQSDLRALAKAADSLSVDWTNVPKNPWAVRLPDGRAVSRHATQDEASAVARKLMGVK